MSLVSAVNLGLVFLAISFIIFEAPVFGQTSSNSQFVILASSPLATLAQNVTLDAYNNTLNSTLFYRGVTIQVVQGTYPITCDSSTIRLVNFTATDPSDNVGGSNDNVPANSIGLDKQNDPVPSLISLPYIAINPDNGDLLVKKQLFTGTTPRDANQTFIICATTGLMTQNYDVFCLDKTGMSSNHVQFAVNFPACDSFVP